MIRRRLPINDHERLLLELLQRERVAMIPRISLGRYTGIADYVLSEGEFFDVLESTDRPMAVPSFCYANAYRFARRSNGTLQYAEGYALAEIGTMHFHAWCVDTEGRVVDPTWHGGPKSASGRAYLGRLFDLADVAKARRGPKKSASIINDWRRGFPLFK
jgi:hypothetical protein